MLPANARGFSGAVQVGVVAPIVSAAVIEVETPAHGGDSR